MQCLNNNSITMVCSIIKSQSQAAVRSLCFLNFSEKSRCDQVHLVSDFVNSISLKGLAKNTQVCSLWPCRIHCQATKSLYTYFRTLSTYLTGSQCFFFQTAKSERGIPAEGWEIQKLLAILKCQFAQLAGYAAAFYILMQAPKSIVNISVPSSLEYSY